ncbi:MAG: hypothetical protein AAGA48_04950 [Myxococcota bacterium]
MRPAVLAATLTFHPKTAWARVPFTMLAKLAGPVVIRWLDRRRERNNGR